MTAAAKATIAAAVLLEQVLAALRTTAPFVVLRNYEGLPTDWSNDIDILVPPAALERAHIALLATLQASAGATPIKDLRRFNFRAARLFCADRELHVDLYSSMNKAWAIYTDTAAVLDARRPVHPLFDVPAELHELLLIAAKELFAYGRIRGRYHDRLAGHDPSAAQKATSEIFGSYLTIEGQELVTRALVDPTVTGRPRLRAGTILRPGRALCWARMRGNGWTALPAAEGTAS